MSMMRFGMIFGELAVRETRTVILPNTAQEHGRVILSADEYGFDEL